MVNLLYGLDDAQKHVVKSTAQHMLTIAGAGAGKTRVLTHKIAYDINVLHYNKHKIVALTFTNKAAEEMKERLTRLISQQAKSVHIETFHRFAWHLIRLIGAYLQKYYPSIKLSKIFGNIFFRRLLVVNRDQFLTNIIAKIIQKRTGESISDIFKAMNTKHNKYHHERNQILDDISLAKNDLLGTSNGGTELEAILPSDKKIGLAQKFVSVHPEMHENSDGCKAYFEYQRELSDENLVDLDDFLYLPAYFLMCQFKDTKLQKAQSSVLSYLQSKYQYFNVDEYQDTNHVQFALICCLAGKLGNVFAVGDVDQAIYSWRGADIRNIKDFINDYYPAKIAHLRTNYRSTEPILKVANSIIQYNYNKKHVPNIPCPKNKNFGVPVIHALTVKPSYEAQLAVDMVKKLHTDSHYPYDNIMILARTHSILNKVEGYLYAHNIKYVELKNTDFYRRPDVQLLLHYLDSICESSNSSDRTLCQNIKKIINHPHRGITKKNIKRLFKIKTLTHWPVMETMLRLNKLAKLAKQFNDGHVNMSDFIQMQNQMYPWLKSQINWNKVWKILNKMSTSGKKNITAFGTLLYKWQHIFLHHHAKLSDIIKDILKKTQYIKQLRHIERHASSNLRESQAQTAIRDMKGILTMAKKSDDEHNKMSLLERVNTFASYITIQAIPKNALTESNKMKRSQVTLSTIHSAKGLEQKCVIVVGADAKYFEGHAESAKDMREACRLLYVAATRAEKRLYIISSCSRDSETKRITPDTTRLLQLAENHMKQLPKTINGRKYYRKSDLNKLAKRIFKK